MRLAVLSILVATAGFSRAATMDCLHADGFEPGLAPALYRETQRLHNCARRTAQPRPVPPIQPLAWSDTVAVSAQSWANQCNFSHPGGHPYGENLYAVTGHNSEAAPGVLAWINEYQHYNYGNNTCSPGQVCGHYTQVVWRNTQRLGCGLRQCATGSPFPGFPNWTILVCRYDPPGNFIGQWPY